MSNRYKVAVVGCGYWGPNLIRNFIALTDICQMQLICDMKWERLSHMNQLYPWIEVTTDLHQVLDDPEIDAVAIATPISSHYKLAKMALTAGKHTMIEKPLAATSGECQELIDLAQRQGLVLMVGHTFIYTAAVQYIRKMIEVGELGDIYYISSNRLNLGLFQKDINVAWDLAPHDISILLHILQEQPLYVNCQGKRHLGSGHEDVTNMSLEFPNGTFATIQSSWLDPNKIRKMTIVGSKCMVVYDDTEPLEKIKVYDKRVEIPPHYDTFAEFQYSYHYGDMRAPFIRHSEPLKNECQHFLECIQNGAVPVTDGGDGLRVVQILEAASESLRLGGGRVAIPNGAATLSHA